MVPHAHAIASLFLLGALAVCACATAPPRLPYGGYDASMGVESDVLGRAWLDSQTPCRSPIITARAHVRGTLDRRRIDAWFWVGVDAATGRVRLESVDTGPSRFSFLASYSYGSDRKDEATLLLRTGRWVVHSRSRELVELVLGVPLSAPELQSVLTGCPTVTGNLRFERFDAATMKMVTESGDTVFEVFMRRHGVGSPWAVFATVANVPGRPTRWRADPGERSHGVLESVRLTSVEWNGRSGGLFDLTFSLDHIQTPAPAAELFTLSLPESADPLPVEAVRLNLEQSSLPLLASAQ